MPAIPKNIKLRALVCCAAFAGVFLVNQVLAQDKGKEDDKEAASNAIPKDFPKKPKADDIVKALDLLYQFRKTPFGAKGLNLETWTSVMQLNKRLGAATPKEFTKAFETLFTKNRLEGLYTKDPIRIEWEVRAAINFGVKGLEKHLIIMRDSVWYRWCIFYMLSQDDRKLDKKVMEEFTTWKAARQLFFEVVAGIALSPISERMVKELIELAGDVNVELAKRNYICEIFQLRYNEKSIGLATLQEAKTMAAYESAFILKNKKIKPVGLDYVRTGYVFAVKEAKFIGETIGTSAPNQLLAALPAKTWKTQEVKWWLLPQKDTSFSLYAGNGKFNVVPKWTITSDGKEGEITVMDANDRSLMLRTKLDEWLEISVSWKPTKKGVAININLGRSNLLSSHEIEGHVEYVGIEANTGQVLTAMIEYTNPEIE